MTVARVRHFNALVLLSALALSACAGSRDSLRPLPPRDPMIDVRAQQLVDQGLALAHAGDLVRAEQYVAEGLERGADERRYLPQLLRICIAASRYRAAVTYAQHYLERHPGDWSLRFLVGTIHEELGEHFTARRHFEQVLAAHETHAGAHFMLGRILRDTYSDPEAADLRFRRYLALEPNGTYAEEARSHLVHRIEATPEPPAPPAAPRMIPVQTETTTPASQPAPSSGRQVPR